MDIFAATDWESQLPKPIYREHPFCLIFHDQIPSSANDHCQLDSGATQLALAPIIADAIAAKFNPPAVWNPSLGAYSVPCNAVAPWFAIKIGGVIFPVDKRDMIIDDPNNPRTCLAGTTNGDIYAPYTLGDVFMNNVLVVFDVGSGEMKFRSR